MASCCESNAQRLRNSTSPIPFDMDWWGHSTITIDPPKPYGVFAEPQAGSWGIINWNAQPQDRSTKMSAPLNLPSGDTLDLGSPVVMLGTFAELERVAGDDFERYAELFGVRDTVLEELTPEADWYADVKEQASEFLDDHRATLSANAIALLESLAALQS